MANRHYKRRDLNDQNRLLREGRNPIDGNAYDDDFSPKHRYKNDLNLFQQNEFSPQSESSYPRNIRNKKRMISPYDVSSSSIVKDDSPIIPDLLADDEAFFTMGTALLSFIGIDRGENMPELSNESVAAERRATIKSLQQLMSKEEQIAFHNALEVRFNHLPTYSEKGEDQFTLLIRQCNRRIGDALREIMSFSQEKEYTNREYRKRSSTKNSEMTDQSNIGLESITKEEAKRLNHHVREYQVKKQNPKELNYTFDEGRPNRRHSTSTREMRTPDIDENNYKSSHLQQHQQENLEQTIMEKERNIDATLSTSVGQSSQESTQVSLGNSHSDAQLIDPILHAYPNYVKNIHPHHNSPQQFSDQSSSYPVNMNSKEQCLAKQSISNEMQRIKTSIQNHTSLFPLENIGTGDTHQQRDAIKNRLQYLQAELERIDSGGGKTIKNASVEISTDKKIEQSQQQKDACGNKKEVETKAARRDNEVGNTIVANRKKKKNRDGLEDEKGFVSARSTIESPLNGKMKSSKTLKEISNQKMVQVMAPETLPGEFVFEARLGDEIFLAIVPEGGVTKGEIFESVMADINNAERHYPGIRTKKYVDMNAPYLKWRDEVYDCLSNGFSHPMLWNSICCPQIALAQIMARLQLNFNGDKTDLLKLRVRVKAVEFLTITMLFLHVIFACVISRAYIYHEPTIFYVYSFIPVLFVDICLVIYFYYMLIRTRRVLRKEYNIPQKKCQGCLDLFLAFFFTPCVVSQMGRHTADYETYVGKCCSDNGLPDHIEVKLPSDPSNTVSRQFD